MALYLLPSDIFEIFSRDHQIDQRVIRSVSKAFSDALARAPRTIMASIAANIMYCMRYKYATLARWYYDQDGGATTIDTLTKCEPNFLSMYYYYMPIYIIEDHPEIGINPKYICHYIELLNIPKYVETMLMQPAPNLRESWQSMGSVYHNIACKIVHKCGTSAQTYQILLLLIGHWNAHKNIVSPIIINVSYCQMTELELHSLYFLALCHRNSDAVKSIMRLYKINKHAPMETLEIANMFVDRVSLSELGFATNMHRAYESLAALDAVTPLIKRVYETVLLPQTILVETV
ncbi:hypothetical protein F-VV57_0355 [Faustovirus]|nr:hypothetical protein F-VV57_0355 [Faustovirus]QJX73623.1 hypothetical protein F-VV63_0357 [Faustovirus]